MKIHVTLREDVRKNVAAKQAALDKVLRAGIHDFNHKRFERYGVISGDLDDEASVEALQGISEVSSVERDTEKLAI